MEKIIINGADSIKDLIKLIHEQKNYFDFGYEAKNMQKILELNLSIISRLRERSIEKGLAKFAYLVLFNSEFDIVFLLICKN